MTIENQDDGELLIKERETLEKQALLECPAEFYYELCDCVVNESDQALLDIVQGKINYDLLT